MDVEAKILQQFGEQMAAECDERIIRQLSLQAAIEKMTTEKVIAHLGRYPEDRKYLKNMSDEVKEILKVKDL